MKILKRVKPSRLIFLIVLLAGNTFAWFIYSSKVDGAISVHVKAWDVTFQADESQVTSNLDINVSNIYPGMDDYTYDVTASNNSEVAATLSYKILEANVLGTEYVTPDGRAERGEQVEQDDPTNAELLAILSDDFPFSITFEVDDPVLAAGSGQEDFTLSVVWPYEQNDDEEDTRWGILAATFKEDYPTSPSISLKIKLIITQNAS